MTEIGHQAWGKTDGKGGATHHLLHHSADVAAVFFHLLGLAPFRRAAERAAGRILTETDIVRLSAIAFLHDIGKLSPAFQAKGWPAGLWRRPTRGHLESAWLWLGQAATRTDTALDGIVPRMTSWGLTDNWLAAAFAHHGRPVRKPTRGVEDDFPILPYYDWMREEQQMGWALRNWFARAFDDAPPLPDRPEMLHFFAGLLALSDWVGSDRAAFNFVADIDTNYWPCARDRAARHLRAIGLNTGHRHLRQTPDFALVSGHPAPNGAQQAVGAAPVDSNLLILEAETGSGKTEAALWRFAALHSAGAIEGLYFAVPTRAAARQLHGRVNDALTRMFEDAPEAVLAIPGMVVAGQATGIRLPGWQVLWDDDAGAAHSSRWAAEHATRYLASEVAVGTVDQAMLAALRVKHGHLRAAALSRSLLVIDEVHASDAYMGHVQTALLQTHLALGGHAMLMSATLGSAARARWMGSPPPSLQAAQAIPYPAVWLSGDSSPRAVPASGREKIVAITAQRDWSGTAAAKLALEAAAQGARTLVIRNTVDRARETWSSTVDGAPARVMQVAGGPALHHSRFAAEDRALLDRAVESALGKDAPSRGMIVIGTQTLEQSLDIDADLLITDLCPVDVLLQRIGRLHRHDRARPEGFEQARAVVLCPDALDPLLTRAENGLGAYVRDGSLSGVYVDVPALAATLQQIEALPHWRIPQMNRALVEAATHPEALDHVAAARGWESYRQSVTGQALAQAGMAGRVVLDRGQPLPDRYPDEERIKTRIGEDGVVIDIPGAPDGPFGTPVSRIALPAHWSRGLTGEEIAEAETVASGLILSIAGRRYLYDRSGLSRA